MKCAHVLAAAAAAVLAAAAPQTSPKPDNITIAVTGADKIIITKDGKRITCGQLRAMYQQEGVPKKYGFSCSALRAYTIARTRGEVWTDPQSSRVPSPH
jgi:hypothetical protein